MNITNVIDEIKMTNGLSELALPFKEPIENVILKILKISINTFSYFKPQVKESIEHRKNLQSPDDYSKKLGIIVLPPNLTSTPVKYADACLASGQFQSNEATTNNFTVGTPFVGFGSYYPQDILNAEMTGAAINKFAGITSRVPTGKWLGFNKIQLLDFPQECYVHFTVYCAHDANGESIPDSCAESFTQLAQLDVQRTLYNYLKNMNHIGGAFKDQVLNIENWANAESDRKALIEKWTGNFHHDDLDLVQFF